MKKRLNQTKQENGSSNTILVRVKILNNLQPYEIDDRETRLAEVLLKTQKSILKQVTNKMLNEAA